MLAVQAPEPAELAGSAWLSAVTAKPDIAAAARSANNSTAWPSPAGFSAASGATRISRPPATRSPSRLVASRCDSSVDSSTTVASRSQASIKCSQLSSTSSIRRHPRKSINAAVGSPTVS